MEEYRQQFDQFKQSKRITSSNSFFKIKLFQQKGENSFLIAKYLKELEPNKDLPKKIFWNYWAITISYYSMLYSAKALILSKGYEVHDHDACQVALGYLCVPDQMKREDLELLNQSYKIFEDEYVKYFEDAKIEARTARYAAIKTYTERRLQEIQEKARKFNAKIGLILS